MTGTEEDSKLRSLGLIGSSPSSDGQPVVPGSRVALRGRIIRMHSSGFCTVEIEGAQPQPAVVAHARNLVRLEVEE